MSRKLRVATIGAGFFSQFHYQSWVRIPDVELVAICNRTEATAREYAERYGIPRVFTDPATMMDAVEIDLVDIITPPPTHLDCIREATRRKIAAKCQKPFTPTLGEAREAVELAAAAGSLLVVHEDYRFMPWHAKAKEMLDAGTLGEPYQVHFWLRPGDGQGPRAYLDRQPYFQQMPRFLVHETAIHLIDVFRYLFGEVAAVYADLRRLNPVIAGEDAGIVLFDFAAGARGTFDGNRLVDHESDSPRRTMGEMLIEGSLAALRLDGYGRLFLRRSGGRPEPVPLTFDDAHVSGDCDHVLQRHLVDHLLRGSPVMNRGAEYLRNLEVEEAVYRSAAEGRKVLLERPS